MNSTPWGGRVFFRPSTTSTMDDAQALEARGEPDGSVAWAAQQSAGRGRHPGRAWYGSPHASLMFTVYWKPTRFLVGAFAPSLTVGLGVCLWLESLGLGPEFPVALKWPNDVYLADRKAVGILVTRRWGASGSGAIHAGIGVNLQMPASGEAFRTPPISLAEAGILLTPEDALRSLLPFLAQALDHRQPRQACEARLWRRGQELELMDSVEQGVPRCGLVHGLDEAGRLLWDDGRGLRALSSGE